MAWEEIETVTLGSAAASVSFTTGLTAYKFFRLTVFIKNDANAKTASIRLNNDGGTTYARQYLAAQSTTVLGARSTGQTSALLNVVGGDIDANSYLSASVLIAKPSASVKGQLTIHSGYDPAALMTMELWGVEWNNTADLISRIDVIASSNNFAAGTSVLLEGLAL